jgi:hypothetical protein
MALVRPRLTEYYGVAVSQADADFAIPFVEEDVPLYVDPFLLWKSVAQQDNALHTSILTSFNHFGQLYRTGSKDRAVDAVVRMSECAEVGLGHARNKKGRRIGSDTAVSMLELFEQIPRVKTGGFAHFEEVQLYVDQISKDRISDFSCNLIKSFLIDYTIAMSKRWGIPTTSVSMEVLDTRDHAFKAETVSVPVNPATKEPILMVPKRWLRFVPWINYDDYFRQSHADENTPVPRDRIELLTYNRHHYDFVDTYVAAKERTQADCHNDPLFQQIPVLSAKRKLQELKALPSGTTQRADKRYEDLMAQLFASLLYPHLDFAADQSRTDSGTLIRDLIFYNNRSVDFLVDIFQQYGSRQIVMEMKNVRAVEREHVNQLNRYLSEEFGRFGILITRNVLPGNIRKNTIDLWAGQRRCIIPLTDDDVETMVDVFESKQRQPIEVVKRAYIQFTRECPS